MFQLDFESGLGNLLLLAFVLMIGAVILLLAVEFNAAPRNKEKQIIRLLQEHHFILEATIQTSLAAGIFLVCLSVALVSSDVVLSIDMTVFPFVVTPIFIIGIHRMMRHFQDIVEEHTIGMPGETFESLEPTMYARIILVYWVGSLITLVFHFALSISGAFPAIASVLMHYGLGGLLFFSSSLLFSLGSLRRKRALSQ